MKQDHATEYRLTGAWSAQAYHLKSGEEHVVKGHIFFGQKEWTVLFFVVGEDGNPRRGSAEGGLYTLTGDRLEFRHRYYLAGGSAAGELQERPFQMKIRPAAGMLEENCSIRMEGDRLTIHFPSGNSMSFLRE